MLWAPASIEWAMRRGGHMLAVVDPPQSRSRWTTPAPACRPRRNGWRAVAISVCGAGAAWAIRALPVVAVVILWLVANLFLNDGSFVPLCSWWQRVHSAIPIGV
jgi:hypothetical protein